MASPIPEYYRHLADKGRPEPKEEAVVPGARSAPARPVPPAVRSPRAPAREAQPVPEPPSITFQADRFAMRLYEGWEDKTAYVLAGPVSDGLQHNVVVLVEPNVEGLSLEELVDLQVQGLEENLKGCRILLRGPARLASGLEAVRVVYSWCPADGVRFYQEQLYLLHAETAYKLTATFTKKTRKMLGGQVEQVMLSFEPQAVRT